MLEEIRAYCLEAKDSSIKSNKDPEVFKKKFLSRIRIFFNWNTHISYFILSDCKKNENYTKNFGWLLKNSNNEQCFNLSLIHI